MKSTGIHSLALGILLSFASIALAEDAQAPEPAKTEKAFEVTDIPKPEPIEGQLGEPGAPSLADSQEKLAKAMLEKGICNASFYGEDFCKKQETKTFRVTDQFGSSSVRVKDKSQE